MRIKMAERGRDSTAVLFFSVLLGLLAFSGGTRVTKGSEAGQREPLYVRKARLLVQRQQAYEATMQARMTALSQALAAFSSSLYLQHVKDNADNVLVSPLSAYVSLAMVLTASRGSTKKQVLSALRLQGQGRGIHTSLQRALNSLLQDDTDDINDDLSAGVDLDDMQSDDPGVDLSYQDLENILRNDYLLDSKISYNMGQTHIQYSTAVKSRRERETEDKPSSSQPELLVRAANGMFHSEDVALSQVFSNRLASLYGAPPMAMEHSQPRVSVNLWVDAVTRATIPDMLAPGAVSQHTMLVLVSALSFWGQWQSKFDARDTIPLDFKTHAGDTVVAPCMYQAGNFSVKTVDEAGGKILEIPYANTRYSLFVLLPRSPTGLASLEQSLDSVGLQRLLQDMPAPRMTVLLLPKFHLRSRVSLKAELKRQGVRRLFVKQQADLRRMTDEDERLLYVSDVFQYTALEVNEGKKRDVSPNTITIGSYWDDTNTTDSTFNTSNHIHITDKDDNNDNEEIYNNEKEIDNDENKVNDEIDDDNNDDEDYDYEDYDYEDYDEDYEEEEGFEHDSSDYFIVDRPFLFVVKDKLHDLVVLMGRVTNPLP